MIHTTLFRKTTPNLMKAVIVALLPSALSLTWFAPWAAAHMIVSGLSAMLFESLALLLRPSLRAMHPRWPIPTDGAALLTGFLLGFCLPPSGPLWLGFAGSFFAIIIGKQVYGGLGNNPFNPAMVGYVMLLVGFPFAMTHGDHATITGPTLLDRAQTLTPEGWLQSQAYTQALWFSGASLLGGAFLYCCKVIALRIPLAVLLGFATSMWMLEEFSFQIMFAHLPLGGLVFGAVFIATDPVSAPLDHREQWIYGLTIGALTALIRSIHHYPEGFAFAVLLANMWASTTLVGVVASFKRIFLTWLKRNRTL